MSTAGAPLPVLTIGGYLGAGKTTLVNHLLRHANGRRLMVMVNDFGELPIDTDLIESRDGNTITLANGCICCSIGADLAGAFIDLLNLNPLPDHLLIEASGVAEPHRIANIARAEPDLELRAIVVLADAPSLLSQAGDELVGEAVRKQLAAADLLLLNKIDLVPTDAQDEIESWIAQSYPGLRYMTCAFAQISNEILDAVPGPLGTTEGGHSHEEQYVRWSLVSEQPLARALLEGVLNALPGGVLRLKGIVNLEGEPGSWSVQCVGPRWTITPHAAGTESRLVAIGLKAKVLPADLDDLFASSGKQ